jgi:hypothetical protein
MILIHSGSPLYVDVAFISTDHRTSGQPARPSCIFHDALLIMLGTIDNNHSVLYFAERCYAVVAQ